MIGSFVAWRRLLRTWAPALAFFVINAVVLIVYLTAFAGRVDRLDDRTADTREEVEALRGEIAAGESFLERSAANRAAVDELYTEHFSTEARRFTRTLTEVRRLARQAGLRPTSFSYPQSEVRDLDLSQRKIVFSVQGTYVQLRTYLSLLELSDLFIAVESVSLTDSGESTGKPQLSIRLTLSTIFATELPQPRRVAERGPAGEPAAEGAG